MVMTLQKEHRSYNFS